MLAAARVGGGGGEDGGEELAAGGDAEAEQGAALIEPVQHAVRRGAERAEERCERGDIAK